MLSCFNVINCLPPPPRPLPTHTPSALGLMLISAPMTWILSSLRATLEMRVLSRRTRKASIRFYKLLWANKRAAEFTQIITCDCLINLTLYRKRTQRSRRLRQGQTGRNWETISVICLEML